MSPYDRHADKRAALLRTVLTTAGHSGAAIREAAFHGGALPATLAAYLEKVRTASFRVTDDDIKGLIEIGFSEDAIFELTVAAALGAADQRLHAGLSALRSIDRAP
jgi:alkylhydroperoxidase family enzyme